tara:strand:- start:511 stop:1185 length:675 start_codon:yes stop_codon:yes gene_type:complete
MGYLDNSSVIVDAILTKKGRELLAKGNNQFNITKFALSDDEVDYSLYNPAHPLGTDYYGIAIENLPMLEASPDETTTMRYKLVTLPKGTPRIPQITIPGGAITLTGPQDVNIPVQPITSTPGDIFQPNQNLGYTAILHNSDVATLEVTQASPGGDAITAPTFLSDSEVRESISKVGLRFSLSYKTQVDADLTTKLTIIGNETGGQASINVTSSKLIVETTNSLA